MRKMTLHQNKLIRLRSCLKCFGEFKSHGPSNRICNTCTKVNRSQRVMTETKHLHFLKVL